MEKLEPLIYSRCKREAYIHTRTHKRPAKIHTHRTGSRVVFPRHKAFTNSGLDLFRACVESKKNQRGNTGTFTLSPSLSLVEGDGWKDRAKTHFREGNKNFKYLNGNRSCGVPCPISPAMLASCPILSLFLSFLVEWDKMEYFVAINCKTIWMFCVDLEFECVTYIYIYKVNFCINWALKIFRIKSDWKAFENFSYCMGSK